MVQSHGVPRVWGTEVFKSTSMHKTDSWSPAGKMSKSELIQVVDHFFERLLFQPDDRLATDELVRLAPEAEIR